MNVFSKSFQLDINLGGRTSLSFQNKKLRLKTVMEYPYKAIKGRALY
ncbi:hypothetical protein VCJ_000743 [Vibrio metoecus]|nr:hypothetical protein VCJ_000743 [Vibrio metoecus]